MYKTKSEFSDKLRTYGNYHGPMEVHQLQQIHCSGGAACNGGDHAWVGVGVYGKSLYLSLSFAGNLSGYSPKIKPAKNQLQVDYLDSLINIC